MQKSWSSEFIDEGESTAVRDWFERKRHARDAVEIHIHTQTSSRGECSHDSETFS